MEWLFNFPFVMKPDLNAIDSAVRGFALWASPVLDGISGGLTALVNGIGWLLAHIPWFLLIGAVFFLGWKSRKSIRSGILYAALLALIGVGGYWSALITTLAIVIAGVIISLLIGLPVGILLSTSRRLNNLARPVLDTMQTMPVFVYLIPALLFFGLGSPSAVIATVIYAVVPVIRLTSLGVRQVDREVVEAAASFGSTRMQALFKV